MAKKAVEVTETHEKEYSLSDYLDFTEPIESRKRILKMKYKAHSADKKKSSEWNKLVKY